MYCLCSNIDETWRSGLRLINSRIRSRSQCAILILESMRYLLYHPIETLEPGKEVLVPTVCLFSNDHMSRIFFFLERKYFSLHFPFVFKPQQGALTYFYQGSIISSQMISWLITILRQDVEHKTILIDGIDFPEGTSEEDYRVLSNLVLYILSQEGGYIRYDEDEEGYNYAEDKTVHPLHHLDICYSQQCTFKVGLKERFKTSSFFDFLDNLKPRSVVSR